jgi:prepilin-type N-terminal cleavage/methylation domain-containing protein
VITMRVRLPAGRAGFTLVELMIAMIVGLVVLAAATAVVATTWKGIAGGRSREGLERNARFINEALNRDLSETGVDLASSVQFGALGVRNDTLVILGVPYVNDTVAAPHTFQYGGAPLAPATGSCGTYCVDVDTVRWDIAANDLALLQANNERRLIGVTSVNRAGAVASVTFHPDTSFLLHEGAYARNMILPNNGVVVRKLRFAAYWVENGSLMRAQELNPDGSPKGELVATGVDSIRVRLVFSDGTEATTADPTDGNGDNDWDDILAVRVNAWLQADPTDRRVNNGQPVTRAYSWWFAPRNLRYEKNRIT